MGGWEGAVSSSSVNAANGLGHVGASRAGSPLSLAPTSLSSLGTPALTLLHVNHVVYYAGLIYYVLALRGMHPPGGSPPGPVYYWVLVNYVFPSGDARPGASRVSGTAARSPGSRG